MWRRLRGKASIYPIEETAGNGRGFGKDADAPAPFADCHSRKAIERSMTETYLDAGPDDLGIGQCRPVSLNEWPILLCREERGLFAVVNRCPHAVSPLNGGRLRRGMIACPLHGARFDISTGACIGGQYRPLKTFAVRSEGERLWILVPDQTPGPEHRLPVQAGNPCPQVKDAVPQ